jgi:hypothetical protein
VTNAQITNFFLIIGTLCLAVVAAINNGVVGFLTVIGIAMVMIGLLRAIIYYGDK